MKKLPFIFLFLFKFLISSAQTVASCHKEGGAFISEVGNISHADFIELTVYGSTSNPTAPVNMENWILDDNNFTLEQTGSHTGHIRLHGDCFKAVMPGTVILIYTNLVQQQLITDLDAPSGYNMRLSQTCLIRIKDCPSKDYPNDYSSCLNNYNGNDGAINLKHYIPLRNEGDVIQLMNAEGELQHAIYWIEDYVQKDNPRAVNVINKLQNGSANKLSIKFISDRDWFNPANYIADNDFSTLGTANNASHKSLIDNSKNGTYSSALQALVTVKEQPSSKDNDGIIEVQVLSGQPQIKVSISSDDFSDWEFLDNAGTHIFKGLAHGTYSVLIEDKDFCVIEEEVTLEETKAFCPGACQPIGIVPDDYCKYQWEPHSDIQYPNSAMNTVCPTETTTYTLNVLDKDGNKKQLKFKVEIKKAEVEPSPVLFCGGNKQITVKGKDPLWFNGSTNESVDIDKPGKYSVQVTDESGCRINGEVEVLDAKHPNSIRRYFEAAGFEAVTQNVRIVSFAGKPSKDKDSTIAAKPPTTCVHKFSNDQLFINNEYMDLEELGADICYYEPDFANLHIISDNDNFCKNGNLDAIEQLYASNDKAVWYHLWTNGVESVLFYKQKKIDKAKDCSLKNLKNIFKKYEGKKKYKMLFVIPDLTNRTYREVATLKNDWLFGVVVLDAAKENDVVTAFNDGNLKQHDKEIKMRSYCIGTYNVNSAICFYNDNRKDFSNNTINNGGAKARMKDTRNNTYPDNLPKERAIPMYENPTTLLISISEKQEPTPKGERVVSSDQDVIASKSIDDALTRNVFNL